MLSALALYLVDRGIAEQWHPFGSLAALYREDLGGAGRKAYEANSRIIYIAGHNLHNSCCNAGYGLAHICKKGASELLMTRITQPRLARHKTRQLDDISGLLREDITLLGQLDEAESLNFDYQPLIDYLTELNPGR